MKYPAILFLSTLFIGATIFAQTKKDSSNQKIPLEKQSQIPPSIENKFDAKSAVRLFKEDYAIPLDLKKYSALMSMDISTANNFTREELNSGLLENEIKSFRSNKNSTMQMLSEFYGEDLVNIQKLLDNLGLTKDQVVGFLMVLKFVFGQALIK